LGYDINSYINYLKRITSTKEKNTEIINKTHPPVNSRISAIDEFLSKQKLNKSGKTNAKRFKENIKGNLK
jgi:predicted Zn-dependent protease